MKIKTILFTILFAILEVCFGIIKILLQRFDSELISIGIVIFLCGMPTKERILLITGGVLVVYGFTISVLKFYKHIETDLRAKIKEINECKKKCESIINTTEGLKNYEEVYKELIDKIAEVMEE